MRKVARVVRSSDVVKVMLYQQPEGVYVFEYDAIEDAPAISDYLATDMIQALEIAFNEFGIEVSDWYEVDEPLENCLPDWIAPVRPLGFGTSRVDWSRYEMLSEGRWTVLPM